MIVALRRLFVALACGLFFSAGLASVATAATLKVSPASNTVAVGDTFKISIRVSSADQAINAISGTLTFPADRLRVASLSKASSIISFWVEDPTYSNGGGTITFEGIVPNPAFIGADGRVLTITFEARGEGSAGLGIIGAQVLANDGQGTNVLTGTEGGSVSINAAALPPAAPSAKIKASNLPAVTVASGTTSVEMQAPLITSFTQNVAVGGEAEVSGASIYPGAIAQLTLRRVAAAPLISSTTVAQNGTFSLVQLNNVPSGDYTGSVMIDKDGAESPPSQSFVIHFEGESLSALLLEFLGRPSVMIALALMTAFVLGIACMRFFFGIAHRRDHSMREMLRDVDVEVHKAFLTLREKVNQSIEELEKEGVHRKLTPAEARFVKEMTSTIKDAEKVVSKDIREGGK